MRWTVWLFGREVFATEITRAVASDEETALEYVSNLAAVIEETDGDDGTRYAPGFSEDDCFEPEERTEFRTGFAGGL